MKTKVLTKSNVSNLYRKLDVLQRDLSGPYSNVQSTNNFNVLSTELHTVVGTLSGTVKSATLK